MIRNALRRCSATSWPAVLLGVVPLVAGCSAASTPSGGDGGETVIDAASEAEANDAARANPDAAADTSAPPPSDSGPVEASDATVQGDGEAGVAVDATVSSEAGVDGGADASNACPSVAVDDAASPGVVLTTPPVPGVQGAPPQFAFGPSMCVPAASQPLMIANPSPVPVTWSATAVNGALDVTGSTLAPGECVTANVSMVQTFGTLTGSVTVDDGYRTTVIPMVEDIAGVTGTGSGSVDLGTATVPSVMGVAPASGTVNVTATTSLTGTACPPTTCVFTGDAGTPMCSPTTLIANAGLGCQSACPYPYYLHLGSSGDFSSASGNVGIGLEGQPCTASVTFEGNLVAPGTYTATLPLATALPATTLAVCGSTTVTATLTIVASGSALPPSDTPVALSGVSSGVAAIAAGGDHTCALTTWGQVFCWGSNQFAQSSGVPSGVAAIAAGYDDNCAITTSGDEECWGDNFYDDLGVGSSETFGGSPATVTGLSSGVAALGPGGYNSCAVTSAGAVWCWGQDVFSDSIGPPVGSASGNPPTAIPGLSGITAVAVGSYTVCALSSAGGVSCLGHGYLGNGAYGDSTTPVAISGLSGVTAIAAGQNYNCALTSAGAVLCWGDNSFGELGNGTTTSSGVPVAVSGLSSGVVAIAANASGAHTCALTSSGAVLCWGDNTDGDLGNGSTTQSDVPVAVSGLSSGVAAISAGRFHTCALTTAGGVLCWGDDEFSQLGIGVTLPVPTDGGVAGADAAAPNDAAPESGPASGCSKVDSCPFNTSCASDVFNPPAGCYDEIIPGVETDVWCCGDAGVPDAGAAPPFTGCASATAVACEPGWFGYVTTEACDPLDAWTGCYDGIIAPYDPGVNDSATVIYCCPLSGVQ